MIEVLSLHLICIDLGFLDCLHYKISIVRFSCSYIQFIIKFSSNFVQLGRILFSYFSGSKQICDLLITLKITHGNLSCFKSSLILLYLCLSLCLTSFFSHLFLSISLCFLSWQCGTLILSELCYSLLGVFGFSILSSLQLLKFVSVLSHDARVKLRVIKLFLVSIERNGGHTRDVVRLHGFRLIYLGFIVIHSFSYYAHLA